MFSVAIRGQVCKNFDFEGTHYGNQDSDDENWKDRNGDEDSDL